MKIVATTSLPAVNRWNAARSRQCLLVISIDQYEYKPAGKGPKDLKINPGPWCPQDSTTSQEAMSDWVKDWTCNSAHFSLAISPNNPQLDLIVLYFCSENEGHKSRIIDSVVVVGCNDRPDHAIEKTNNWPLGDRWKIWIDCLLENSLIHH